MINALIVFLIVILAIVCFLMIFAVLMQRPKQEGLGAAFGGGITDQVWGAQTTNVLQKATVILAITFFVITLILSVLVAKKQKHGNTGLEIEGGQQAIGPASSNTEPTLIDTEPTPEPTPEPTEETEKESP